MAPPKTAPGRQIPLDDLVVRHLRREFARVRADATVAEALAELRQQTLPDRVLYLYVLDADGRLAGVVPTRRLLTAAESARIADIAIPRVVTIPDTATVLDACEFFITHRFLAFPVVDAEKRVVGVVDMTLFTEEMEAINERSAAEDVFQLIGVAMEATRRPSPLRAFRLRFPWLLANIGGGLLCAVISSFYETLLQQRIVLALFIPVVLALSESVSMQSVTLALARLHAGAGRGGRLLRDLLRELPIGIMLGLASGLLVGGAAAIWKLDLRAGLVIWISLLLAMLSACLFGVLLPALVRLTGRDPRVAAGPVVLAAGDVACLLLYFNLASWWL